ncbi:hypothetical protein SD80_008475 [Scytonema tolypothrichoides VB-61278]|nr:hypothetical protein SD80_008475 [Scytonema tolypothrichoides VB-61278]
MNANKINSNGRFEINDLIDDAVKNAVARRSQVIDSEDALLVLAQTEAQSILGGAVAITESKISPLITGKIVAPEPTPKPPIKPICPPIVLGLIAVDNPIA